LSDTTQSPADLTLTPVKLTPSRVHGYGNREMYLLQLTLKRRKLTKRLNTYVSERVETATHSKSYKCRLYFTTQK